MTHPTKPICKILWQDYCRMSKIQNNGGKLHSFRVEKIEKYTRFELRRWKNTLVLSWEHEKIHSFRVYFYLVSSNLESLYNREDVNNAMQIVECMTFRQTIEHRGKLHSKRVEKIENYTRSEWKRLKTTLETSGEDWKLHSKRVEKIT